MVDTVYIDVFSGISTQIILPSEVKNSTDRAHFSEQLFTGFPFTNTDSDDVT